jgi:hypothetical protein
MSSVAIPRSETGATLRCVAELRAHFEAYFDTGWFAVLIEGSPIEFTAIREIRAVLARESIYPEDRATLRYGVGLLFRFISQLRRYLVPVLRERLGISGLLPQKSRLTADEYVYRQLVAHTFPDNVDRLEELTRRLSELLKV